MRHDYILHTSDSDYSYAFLHNAVCRICAFCLNWSIDLHAIWLACFYGPVTLEVSIFHPQGKGRFGVKLNQGMELHVDAATWQI